MGNLPVNKSANAIERSTKLVGVRRWRRERTKMMKDWQKMGEIKKRMDGNGKLGIWE